MSLSFKLRAQNLTLSLCTACAVCVPHSLSGMREVGLEELSGSTVALS